MYRVNGLIGKADDLMEQDSAVSCPVCNDDDVTTDVEVIQAVSALAHQYRLLMEQVELSNDDLKKIDAILEFSEYDESLDQAIEHINTSLLAQQELSSIPRKS